MVRKIVFILLMMISFISWGQCQSKKIETDSCGTMIILTLDDYTEFYVAKRDLERISKEFPELKKKLKKAEKLFKKKAELNNVKLEVTQKTLEEVKKLVAELEIESLKREEELRLKKRENKSLKLANIVQGIILVITFTILIAK